MQMSWINDNLFYSSSVVNYKAGTAFQNLIIICKRGKFLMMLILWVVHAHLTTCIMIILQWDMLATTEQLSILTSHTQVQLTNASVDHGP